MAGVECGKFDLDGLPQDEIIALEQVLWVKAQVEEKIFIVDNRPHAVIIFPGQVSVGLCENNKGVNKQIGHFTQTILDNSNSSGSNSAEHKAEAISSSATSSTLEAQKALGASDLNSMGYGPAPVIPSAAVIPMKSNIKTYGPYTSSNFSSSFGGTSIETVADLCPWVFGSVALMNSTGSAMVESRALGLVKAETGSATVPGLPIAGLSSLGAQINGTGPNLSGMTFTFGSNGITTSYQFSTYTPKFGNLTNSQIDKIKSIAKNRQEQLKFLRSQAILQNKIGRQIQQFNRALDKAAKDVLQKPANDKNTVQRLLMGEIYEVSVTTNNETTSQNKTVVNIGSLEKGSVEMREEYDKKAYMSLDGIFGPVSLNGDGDFPRFTNYETGCHKASPLQPQPPFSTDEELSSGLDQYNLEIDQDHTNPLTNDFGADDHHHEGPGKGHTIDIVGREDTVPENGLMTTFYNTEDQARYSEDYRFLGLRGPMVLHAWGYDTEGKPIPNAADELENMATGDFTENNLKDKFFNNWLQHPSAWPVGPIDLRFDRKRGMWVTPQGYKIVVAQLTEALEPYGSATAKLINKNSDEDQTYGEDLWDSDGNAVKATEENDTQAYIKLVDRIGSSFNEDDLVYAYYDTFNCEYIVLATSKQDSVIKFALVQDKNLTTREVQAIIVDKYGYPLRKDGKTPVVDQNDFNANIITVRDPYLNNSDLPPPRGPGQILTELTAFGPALGSISLEEHINGIQLTDGYSDNYKIIGPFIGYALKRESKKIETYIPGGGEVLTQEDVIYEIITLEHFAKYVIGKIGTINGSYEESTEGAGDGYYLGARIGHRQGVVPVGRGHGDLPNNLNVIIRKNLQDFIGMHTFMIGDKIDNPDNTGNILDDIDGCRFIASLDNEVSTTTNLVYDIIECETSALTCSYHIKDQGYGNILNKGDEVKFDDTNYIEGEFLHGFMWDPVISKIHYDETILQNGGVENNDHKTAEIIVGCRGMGQLTGITVGGDLEYTIVTKSEIANVAQRILNVTNPGLFGCPDFDTIDARKINSQSDNFWDGLEPGDIPNENKPIITMSDGQQWMTYDQSIITASWDEYEDADGAVEDCKYKIVYAQEAPVIMTCIAASEFTPEDDKGVNLEFIDTVLPSCQGADRDPVPNILEGNVFNPMGHGAALGDLVTIQRVFVGVDMTTQELSHPRCNYKYIVIGTGKPPE